jgi:acyl-CoA hydrolase
MQRRKPVAPARNITADEAAALVQSNTWIDYCGSLSAPQAFDRALAKRVGSVENVKIRSVISLRPVAAVEADPEGRSFHFFNWHLSGYDRRLHDAGRCHHIPLHLGEVPDYYRRFLAPVDICVLKVAPADASGRFNLGPTVVWLRTIIECARLVIVEVAPAMPRVEGEIAWLHQDEVDFIIDGDGTALPQLPNPPATDVDRRVATLIAGEIDHGACLQIGIGGMPNAVCSLLAQSGVRDLGIHTEMLTDGIIDLYHAGCISGARKAIDREQIVYTFALGSQRSYDTLDRNRDFSIRDVEYTNSPQVILQNPRAVSINNTTQIDLQGQAASESDGHRHISGTGGQVQFVRGAYASPGGKSFICLASTYDKRGERRSRIVFDLTRGNIVTTPRSDVMYIVTEYGIVNLKGKSVPERARALIGLAHPDFREDLERQAHAHRLLPRGLAF